MTPGDQPRPKLSLRTRFHAWWEGYDAKPATPEDGDDGQSAAKPAPEQGLDRHGRPLWSATRVEVAETLWGQGFTTPGGEEYAQHLARPLGLNPAMSVLDVGAGLGGFCRSIAQKPGCWVVGLEASPVLAKMGMERSQAAELAKKAPIRPFNPEKFAYDKRVDTIFCRQTLFTVAQKEQFFDTLEAQLKPRGQALMTDYVLDPQAKLTALEAWAANEPQEPHLWTARDASEAFTQRNLDLRIAEDLTDDHRAQILTGLNAFTQHLATCSMDRQTKAHVLEEIELWARRVKAFSQGLRFYRFHAIKPNSEG